MRPVHLVLAVLLALCCTHDSLSATSWPPSAHWMGLMGDSLANMTVPDMVLPGTHDSGAYELSDDVAPGASEPFVRKLLDDLHSLGVNFPEDVVKDWAISQQYRIYEQLLLGIRYLDIRVVWTGDKFHTEHFMIGVPITDMLGDIRKFMTNQSTEILVLQFGAFYNMSASNQQAFISLVEAEIGQWLLPNTRGLNVTYDEMVRANTRIIAVYDEVLPIVNNSKFFPTAAYLVSTWADKDNYPDMLSIEKKSVQQQSGNPSQLFKLQYILTASEDRVVSALLDPFDTVDSLHALSRLCNVHFDAFVEDMDQYLINILMTDAFEETDNVERSRTINRRQCNDVPQYRQYECEKWAELGLCASNATVQTWCRRSCKLCKPIPGEPGDSCTENGQCIYNICSGNGICLTDEPRPTGSPCGVDYQCKSSLCANFACVSSA